MFGGQGRYSPGAGALSLRAATLTPLLFATGRVVGRERRLIARRTPRDLAEQAPLWPMQQPQTLPPGRVLSWGGAEANPKADTLDAITRFCVQNIPQLG